MIKYLCNIGFMMLLGLAAQGQIDTIRSGFGGVVTISGLTQLDSLTWEVTVTSSNWKGAWNPLANSEFPFTGISVSDNFFVNCTAFRVNGIADPVPGTVKVLTIARPAGIGNDPSIALNAAIFNRTSLQKLPRINRAVTEPGEVGLSREDYECIMNDFVARVEQNSVDAVRRDSTYEIPTIADTLGLSPIQGDRFVLSNKSLFGLYDSGAWILIPVGSGSLVADTARFLVYAPAHGLADSISTYGYVPVKVNYTKANSVAFDSTHFAYAVGAPHADTLELKLSGPLEIPGHGLTIGRLYYLQDDGTEDTTPGTVRAPTVYVLDGGLVVLSEVGVDQGLVISRQAVPSPVFTFWGGDPQNPSDSIMQIVVDSVFAPAGLAKPSTIFFMSYSSQSKNPTYQEDSPTDKPLNPSHSWFYDGNVVTRINHLLTSIDLQATSAGLFTLDTVMLVLGVPTDSTVADWLDSNYVQNNLRVPNGTILYWQGEGTAQSPDYAWIVIDDITNTGESNDYKRILKRIVSPDVGMNGSGIANYVAKWASPDSLTTADIVDDGSLIVIGASRDELEVNAGDSLLVDAPVVNIGDQPSATVRVSDNEDEVTIQGGTSENRVVVGDNGVEIEVGGGSYSLASGTPPVDGLPYVQAWTDNVPDWKYFPDSLVLDSLINRVDSLREVGDKEAPKLFSFFDRSIQLNNCETMVGVYTGFALTDDTPIDPGSLLFEINSVTAPIIYDWFNEDSTQYYFETTGFRSAGSYTVDVSYTDGDGNFVGEAAIFDVYAGRHDTVTVFDPPGQDSILVTRVCGVEISRDTIATGGGAADGVATAGTHDTGNEELDFTVASPGSNFSVDISALASDAELGEKLGGTLTDNYVPVYDAAGDSLQDSPIYTDGANVSFGTTSTSSSWPVTVYRPGYIAGAWGLKISAENSSVAPTLRLAYGTSEAYAWEIASIPGTSRILSFRYNGTEKFSFSSAGDFTAARYISSGSQFQNTGAVGGITRLGGGSINLYDAGDGGISFFLPSGGPYPHFQFHNSATDRVGILRSDGKLAIGSSTSDPVYRMELQGSNAALRLFPYTGTPVNASGVHYTSSTNRPHFMDGTTDWPMVRGSVENFTTGSLLFAGSSGQAQQDNTNLFWNDTNNRLGIGGITSPARTLHVNGEMRVTDLTTDTPTRIVGADADGDLGEMTAGPGINFDAGSINSNYPLEELAESITYTVCADTCDYATFSAAFEAAKMYRPTYNNSAYTVTILATRNGDGSKYQFATGLSVTAGDWQHVIISSTDTIEYTGTGTAFFCYTGNCFSINGLTLVGAGSGTGLRVDHGTTDWSNINLVENFSTGIRVTRAKGYCIFTSIKDCTTGIRASAATSYRLDGGTISSCGTAVSANTSLLFLEDIIFSSNTLDIAAWSNCSISSNQSLDKVQIGTAPAFNGGNIVTARSVAEANVTLNTWTTLGIIIDESKDMPVVPTQSATYYEETERQYILTTTGADTLITIDTLSAAIATDSISISNGLIENLRSDTVRWQVSYDFFYSSDEDPCYALMDLTTDGTEEPAAIPGSAARAEQVSASGGQMPGRTFTVDVPPGNKIRLCVKGNVGVATQMNISYLTISINEINR